MTNFQVNEDLLRPILQYVLDNQGSGATIDFACANLFPADAIKAHVKYCDAQGWLEGDGPMLLGDSLMVTFQGKGLTMSGEEALQSLNDRLQ